MILPRQLTPGAEPRLASYDFPPPSACDNAIIESIWDANRPTRAIQSVLFIDNNRWYHKGDTLPMSLLHNQCRLFITSLAARHYDSEANTIMLRDPNADVFYDWDGRVAHVHMQCGSGVDPVEYGRARHAQLMRYFD